MAKHFRWLLWIVLVAVLLSGCFGGGSTVTVRARILARFQALMAEDYGWDRHSSLADVSTATMEVFLSYFTDPFSVCWTFSYGTVDELAAKQVTTITETRSFAHADVLAYTAASGAGDAAVGPGVFDDTERMLLERAISLVSHSEADWMDIFTSLEEDTDFTADPGYPKAVGPLVTTSGETAQLSQEYLTRGSFPSGDGEIGASYQEVYALQYIHFDDNWWIDRLDVSRYWYSTQP